LSSLNRRVVVTGLGCVSPIGNTIADAWSAALAGKSGIATITKFDASPFSTNFAGEVKNFNVEDYLPGKEGRHMDSFIHFGMACRHTGAAGFGPGGHRGECGPYRRGHRFGHRRPADDRGHQGRVRQAWSSPYFAVLLPASIINMISGDLSIKFGLRGPNMAIVTACTTGLIASARRPA